MPSADSHFTSPKYRPDIDGLRAVAVLSVVVFHAFPSLMRGGFIGVDVFFVISGYLICTIIFENLARGSFSFAQFYARRVKRIFPALLVVLAATLVAGWFVLIAEEYKQLGEHVFGGAAFISNFVLWGESGYFDNAAETKPLLHLWSLGIEEQFYIVWPAVLWFAWKCRANLLLVTLAAAAASLYLNLKGAGQDALGTFYSPQTRFWELLCGSVLAWYTLRQQGALQPTNAAQATEAAAPASALPPTTPQAPTQQRTAYANACSIIGALLLAVGFALIHKDLNFPGYWALLPVLGAVLIIHAGPQPWVNRVLLSNRVMVWFGLISFPLYLWHWPLLSFTRVLQTDPSPALRVAAVVVAVVLAWLTYRFIERPLRWGGNGRYKVAALVVLMVLVGAAGYTTDKQDGFAFRYKTNIAMDERTIAAERGSYWTGSLEQRYATAPTKVLIFGDSQGFDIYKALKNDPQLGVKIYQTSHECTAFNLPKQRQEQKAQRCQDAYNAFITSPALATADVVVYAVFWNKEAEATNALASYQAGVQQIRVRNPKAKIVLFGPKPLLGSAWVSINTIVRDHKSVIGMDEYLNKVMLIMQADSDYAQQLSQTLGVMYVDVNKVYCLGGCQFYINKMFTHFDQAHWTEYGARVFFEKLKRSGAYAALTRK